MPILDPSTQNSLIKVKNKLGLNIFFLRFLKIASQNLYRNSQTIEASIQFKKDLKASISYLNQYFKCDFKHESDFDDPRIKDYFHFLYEHINPEYRIKIKKRPKGLYKYIDNSSRIDVFIPQNNIINYKWFLTKYPVAILSITINSKFIDVQFIIKAVNLEIDLLVASGFTIVLCLEVNLSCKDIPLILTEMIATHKIDEIHLNIKFNKKTKNQFIDDFFQNLFDIYDDTTGYFYIYSKYIYDDCKKAKKAIKQLKQRPKFNIIFFEDNYFDILSYDLIPTKPFCFCSNGFEEDKIFVSLCNFPLYKTAKNDDILVSEVSGLTTGFILAKDFLNCKNERVKIIVSDKSNDKHIQRYVDFDHIHSIKFDHYVKSTIFLVKAERNLLRSVFNITESKLDNINEQELIKNILHFLQNKETINAVTFISKFYEKIAEQSFPRFQLRTNQLFTILESCNNYIFKTKETNKGIVYQIETGEGKSCIIQIIAAILALLNKTVHIISSNITLSNRDYISSYKFFKQLELSSAVLLHYNELPFASFNNSQIDKTNEQKKFYSDKFFGIDLFNNSMNMNISVCGINSKSLSTKNKANIIFSTIVNFEILYLKMIEICPNDITDYFERCHLLIDEADSILIDELTNGTILSRTIQSNANEILKYVYRSRISNVPAEAVLEYIHDKWPKCTDLKLKDINLMFDEIDLIHQDEFVNGRKYSIEEFEIKEEEIKLIDIIKDFDIQKCKRIATNFFSRFQMKKKREKMKNCEDFEEKYLSDDDENDNKEANSSTIKLIIPFDYDHKGILEPNKEFSGFVQQFIAIKEMEKNGANENMKIKQLSMNYLSVYHPTFVNLYNGVIGFTGTIGNKYDKAIFKKQYQLNTMKIPRSNANKRVEFPVVLCNDIYHRNIKITEDILHIHSKGNPILVIFQDLNEIADILYSLSMNGIKNINIFDGKDEKIKPDLIAGLKGAISLGTNVCGRGTDIQHPVMPLHVIITYYSSNSRVMSQLFGRTARQGQEGTVRIICVKDQYILPIEQIDQNDINNTLDDFKFKNDLQISFIKKYKMQRDWIFSGEVKSQELTDEIVTTMREVKINSNRIKACNYEFPLCMSIPTFLKIQAQKIFSLYNCPNCKYTWMLFQKYLREMILESWALFIDRTEKNYHLKERSISYKDYMNNKINKLYDYLNEYLPDSSVSYDIIPTFMHIFNKVVIEYETMILKTYPDSFTKVFKQFGTKRFCSFTIGFKPYSLVDESGARINTIDGTDQSQHYISDPELKYIRAQSKGPSILLSITEKIDDIFNWMCQKINSVIGSFFGLKFFLRRTLGGCEFGVCLDFDIENIISEDKNCLIDTDPLFCFTISVKSTAPLLAGILIIGLVYIASITKSISEWITAFPAKITKLIIKKTLIEVASVILASQIEKLCDSVCSFLIQIINKQINKMNNNQISSIFQLLLKIAEPKDFSNAGERIGKIFNEKANIKIRSSFAKKIIKEKLPFAHFAKIGFLLILCLSSFMTYFHFHHNSLRYDASKTAQEYDEHQDTSLAMKQNKKQVKKSDICKIKDIDLNIA